MNVDVVRNHWNWTGVIESDCGAVSGIIAHGNAKTHAEAAAIALDATLDVECDSIYANDQTLLHLEELGIVKRSQLEAAVARVFKGRFQLGQFDPNKTMTGYDHLHTDQVRCCASNCCSRSHDQHYTPCCCMHVFFNCSVVCVRLHFLFFFSSFFGFSNQTKIT